MKTKKIIFAVAIIPLCLACFLFFKSQTSESAHLVSESAGIDSVKNQPIGAQYTESSLFLSEIKKTKLKPATETVTGLIVPHHLLAKDMIVNAFAYAATGKYQTIVLLSPDHFQAGQSELSTTERDFSTVFGTVETEKNISHQIKKLSFVGEGDFFYREHGLQAQLPFIKYYFPQTKIVAIAFKPTINKNKLDQVIEILEKTLPLNSLIIQSTDFSHYLTPAQAAERDLKTIAVINNKDQGKILELNQPDNLDSAASLYVQATLQENFFKAQANILEHKNSQDYTLEKVTSSTSYLTTAYIKPLSSGINTNYKNQIDGSAKFIFVGDVMLSRHIGTIMERRQDYSFPFKLILPYLTEADLVFGNLESPVSDRGQSAGHLYSFRADPRVIAGLKNAGFTVLSVANNHAFDYGLEAFTDTINNLKTAGLAYTGGGNNFVEAHQGAFKEINGIKIIILAYTDLLPKSQMATEKQAGFAYLDEAQMVKDIKAAKEKSDLVIVSFHWGREYETKSNNRQKKVAREAVEAGASLIIGHHPHVAQEIGEIQGVPVAYSLGNFVFDQNFSTETKTGLIFEVNVKDKKIIKTEAKTIRFNNYFQPYLSP